MLITTIEVHFTSCVSWYNFADTISNLLIFLFRFVKINPRAIVTRASSYYYHKIGFSQKVFTGCIVIRYMIVS